MAVMPKIGNGKKDRGLWRSQHQVSFEGVSRIIEQDCYGVSFHIEYGDVIKAVSIQVPGHNIHRSFLSSDLYWRPISIFSIRIKNRKA
jgi:hypothetical protein